VGPGSEETRSGSAGARGGWAEREEELAGLRASGTRDWADGAGEGSKLGHGEREKEGAGWAGLGWGLGFFPFSRFSLLLFFQTTLNSI